MQRPTEPKPKPSCGWPKIHQYAVAIALVTIISFDSGQILAAPSTEAHDRLERRDSPSHSDTDDAALQTRNGHSQPEEIFQVDGPTDSDYGEYPMVVPKRAALLLDRLMLALHNALEKEQIEPGKLQSQRLSPKLPDGNDALWKSVAAPALKAEIPRSMSSFSMYIDDDPSMAQDYDYRDLNGIGQASEDAQTSAQRRANTANYGYADELRTRGGIRTLVAPIGMVENMMASASAGAGAGPGAGPGAVDQLAVQSIPRVANGRGSGRVYWRCYFNAVSCF